MEKFARWFAAYLLTWSVSEHIAPHNVTTLSGPGVVSSEVLPRITSLPVLFPEEHGNSF